MRIKNHSNRFDLWQKNREIEIKIKKEISANSCNSWQKIYKHEVKN